MDNNINQKIQDNNVDENAVNSTNISGEYVEEKTEVLEPFIDMSSIVPVAPPVALAPEKSPEVEVLTEAPTEELTPTTEVVAEQVTSAPVENTQVEPPKTEEGAFEVGKPLNEVKINEPVKESNFKYIMTIILFIVLGGVALFMPEISNYMAAKKYEREHAALPKIVNGTLKCTLNRNDDKFDMNFTYRFAFSSNKFKKLEFVSETKGDMNLDEAELSQLYNECVVLQGITSELEGISVSCDTEAGKVIKTQSLDYSLINVEQAYSAYSEAGGVYPDYSYLQDMDNIEKNMKAAGYTCERIE